jgi:hypothetical protein
VSDGGVRFWDDALPRLPATGYRVVVEQRVELPAPFVSPAPYVTEQRVEVTGPRFGLDPGDVVSVHPPANADGDFSASLCHAVLDRRTLPWELDPTPVPPGAGARPAPPPWLAVLLLTPEEVVPPDPGTPSADLGGARSVPLAAYLDPPPSVLGPAASREQKDAWLAELPDQQCVVVDVRADAFVAVAPRAAELPYLAHVRQVDPTAQEIVTGEEEDEWFSVVVGNRLPAGSPSGVYVAHLVSVEGFVGVLGGDLPPGTSAVRLLSLARWTFASRPGTAYFAGLMRDLDVDVLRLPPHLRPTGADRAATVARGALDGGYVPVDYRTRLGERTAGWYRGPCLPVQMERNLQPRYPASEAALVYDRETGMFDVSYAVAWQTGRLLALADRQFAISLLRWVRDHHSLAQLLQERLDLFRRYDGLDLPEDLADLLAPGAVRAAGTRFLATVVAPRLGGDGGRAPALGPRRDPSGLLRHLDALPGLVPPDEVEELLASGDDPVAAVLARARAGAGGEEAP